jgi:hypothetical protein
LKVAPATVPVAVDLRRCMGGPTSGVNEATFRVGVSVHVPWIGWQGSVSGHAGIAYLVLDGRAP